MLHERDLFPKSVEEAREASKTGGFFTALSLFCVLALFFGEVTDYLFVPAPIISSLSVDHDSGKLDWSGTSIFQFGGGGHSRGIPINLRMVFSALPCDLVEVDVTDRLMGSASGVENGITKTPYTAEKMHRIMGFGLPNIEAQWVQMTREASASPVSETRCLPCYDNTNNCCNSCQDLKVSFSRQGKSPEDAMTYPQCREGMDACLVEGRIIVGNTRGNFHVGVGSSHAEQGQRHHHHWNRKDRAAGFNVSHYISSLSFGDSFKGRRNALSGTGFIQETAAEQIQYILQVVPVDNTDWRGRRTESFEYAMTRHVTRIDVNNPKRLPGVFVSYDIDAMRLTKKPQPKSFRAFLTRVVGLVGGVWVVLGMCFGGVAQLARAAKKLD